MLSFFWRRHPKVLLSDDFVQGRRRRLAPLPDAWMSKYARANCVIAIVEDQPDWDFALDNEKALDNALGAAIYYGYERPFTPEQQALCDFLVNSLGGQKITMYAWGVYADICGSPAGTMLVLGSDN